MRIPDLDTGLPVTFVNSNGVSFGTNGQSITASISQSIQPGIAAIKDGAGTQTTGSVAFINSNGITFGLSTGAAGGTITASYTQSTSPGAIAAGSQTATSGTLVFSNSNNVTFGMSGSTRITASATYAPVISLWENLSGVMFQGSTFNTLSVVPLNPGEVFPGLITANTVLFGLNGASSQSTASGSALFSFGIYTFNGGTLSLLNSVATSITYAAVSNNSTAFSGFRWLTIHSSQWSAQPVFSQTQYWLGYIVSSSNQTQGISLLGQAYANAQGRQGTMGVNQNGTTGSFGWDIFMGGYTATTSQLPNSIVQSDLNAANTNVGNFLPHVMINNLTGSF